LLDIFRKKLFGKSLFRDHRLEQPLVAEFLDSKEGFFVEVGAFDPVNNSQTFHLENLGWKGICVEPVPAFAEKIRKNRKATVFEAACVSREFAGNTVELNVDGELTSAVRKSREGQTIHVPAMTLDSILQSSRADRVDFLSIDVEGMEVEVLRGLSFDRYRPKLVLIENHGYDSSRHEEMTKVGYKRVRRTGLNDWYVDRAAAFPVSLYGRFQMFRKFHLATPYRRIKQLLRRSR
jgi:FkbM family methyltransferase